MGNVRDGIRSDATCLGGLQHVVSYYHQMERPYGDDSRIDHGITQFAVRPKRSALFHTVSRCCWRFHQPQTEND